MGEGRGIYSVAMFHRNGLATIDACMLEQMPVDLAILMLGTNDLKDCFCATPYMIARGAERLIERIRLGGYGPDGASPEILLVSPIRLNERAAAGWLREEFTALSLEKDALLGARLERAARECGVHFLNAGAHITADPADGVHMNAAGHAQFAERILDKVRAILG